MTDAPLTREELRDELRGALTPLQQAVTVVQQDVTVVKQDVTILKQDVTIVKQDVTVLQNRLSPMQADLNALRHDMTPVRAHLDGMPLLHRNLTTTQNEVRMLAAAFNDFALTSVTKGEIEALHADVNRVQAENAALAVRMETAERLIRELQQSLSRD